jgi:hypothetical protein
MQGAARRKYLATDILVFSSGGLHDGRRSSGAHGRTKTIHLEDPFVIKTTYSRAQQWKINIFVQSWPKILIPSLRSGASCETQLADDQNTFSYFVYGASLVGGVSVFFHCALTTVREDIW